MNRIFLFIFLSREVFSQDTIYFKNGDLKAVKVKEVSEYEIKYNRFENLNGPVYISYKSDIKKLKYFSGLIDTFNVEGQKTNSKIEDGNYNNSLIEVSFLKRLIYKKRHIGDEKLYNLILVYPNQQVSKSMQELYDQMDIYRMKQKKAGSFGLIIGGGAFATGLVGAFLLHPKNDFTYWLGGGLILGGTIMITGQIISTVFKFKRDKKRLLIADTYNKGLQ